MSWIRRTMLVFLAIFRGQTFGRDYYSPCSYPVDPWSSRESFLAKCSSTYLGSKLFCDPDSVLSRTEADSLARTLKKANFSTCFCNEFARRRTEIVENCAVFKASVAFLRRGTLITDQGKRCTIGVRNLHSLRLQSQLMDFGKLIAQMWLTERDCELDLLLVAIQSWIGRDPGVFYLVPILSDRLMTALKNDVHKLTTIQLYRSNMTTLVNQVRNYVESLVNTLGNGNKDENYLKLIENGAKVPMWAVLVIALCILILPVCILIGNLVSIDQRHKSAASTPDHVTIRMANQRWRVGFGGGLWSKNDGAKGGKSGKSSSNIMMFKNFHKKTAAGGGSGGQPVKI